MRRVDVVVPVYRDETITLRALNAVLDHSGPLLGRLLVVNDRSPEPGMAWRLRALRERRDGVYLLDQPFNQGFVRSANLGLAAGRDDVVVLNSDTLVTPGWLDELVGALDSDERLAAVSPLSNNATFCSVPDFGYGGRVDEVPFERLRPAPAPRGARPGRPLRPGLRAGLQRRERLVPAGARARLAGGARQPGLRLPPR
jgi:GT2 family glycosyltransferase